MSFETGSMGFRFMELPREFPKNFLEAFAREAAGPLDVVGASPVRGWVTGRHLLDTSITEPGAFYAGWLRLALREAVRKVPSALLKAEARMEEIAQLAAMGRGFLKGPEKAEIRRGVEERLLPVMPPQVKSLPFVYLPHTEYLYAGVTSNSAFDVLNTALVATIGFGGKAEDPAVLAEKLRRMDVNEWDGVSFSPEMADASAIAAPGREFLTWLWWRAESGDGQVALPDGRTLGVLLEGPLTFMHEGNGAFISVLRNGTPEISVEAKTCLLAGKKLQSAKLTFALDADTIWKFVLDADEFVFRSVVPPKGEAQLSAEDRFRERMEYMEQWREIFLSLYGAFLDERGNATVWTGTVRQMREWVKDRTARR